MVYEHKLDLSTIKTHNFELNSPHSTNYTKDDLKKMYKNMLLIRKLQILCKKSFKKNLIRGFCHLCIGQENIYTGFPFYSIKDTCTSSYRCHGLCFITGSSLRSILCELYGKKDGMNGGKGGSMHLYNSQFYGGHGIVGASVPIGLGIAFKHKYEIMNKVIKNGENSDKNFLHKSINEINQKYFNKNEKTEFNYKVNFTFYGDGASNQGQIFESFNMASIYKLPIIFICENNTYGMWTKSELVCGEINFYKRGQNIKGIQIKDDNIFDLIEVMKFCRKMVLNEPIIVEILTRRLCEHSTRDFVNKAGESFNNENLNIDKVDVVENFKNFLKKFVSEDEILSLEEKCENEVNDAHEYAIKCAEPSEEELFTNVIL